jgi:hypothetical protein
MIAGIVDPKEMTRLILKLINMNKKPTAGAFLRIHPKRFPIRIQGDKTLRRDRCVEYPAAARLLGDNTEETVAIR